MGQVSMFACWLRKIAACLFLYVIFITFNVSTLMAIRPADSNLLLSHVRHVWQTMIQQSYFLGRVIVGHMEIQNYYRFAD
jgi:hypothetical protein